MNLSSKEFDEEIKKSLKETDCYSDINAHYYAKPYAEKLKEILNNCDEFDKYKNNEWKPPSYHRVNKDLIKMCSVASSSRLTFLYFYDDIIANNVEVEVECKNGLQKGFNPQLDAYDKTKKIIMNASVMRFVQIGIRN